ncbi:S8 family serine peptidase [Alteromonas sp. ASW11-36]|uniref:S8 family serine peptidase n=1 Tax=Alteromonas arenosi TaxID=3055817 RepID=A0ABT7SSQ8_9ALTE|nr:S8 family serine peptidase [Alteromonas sp. ASW11-36]MDM7859227.1 S8 family serine peptidase [Alteromonas sp. ASW11-36]
MRILIGFVAAACIGYCSDALAEEASTKQVIRSEADIPRVTIQLLDKPSVMVREGGAGLEDMVRQLEDYATDLSDNYTIEDATTQKELLSLQRTIAMHYARWEEALSYTPMIQALEEKAAARESQGITSDPVAIAMQQSAANDAISFEQAFTVAFAERLNDIDVEIARDNLEQLLGTMKIVSTDLLLGSFESQMDPVAANMGNNVPANLATAILSSRISLITLEQIKGPIISEITAVLEALPTIEQVDLWSQRASQVDNGSEVIVAIWDTGVDSALQGDRMWVNTDAKAGEYQYGLAFGYDYELEPVSLLPKANKYVDELDDMLDLLKGIQDLQSGINSDEAGRAQQAMAALKREEVLDFQERLTVLGSYIHGQHVADIAAQNLTSVKLMNIRMSWPDDPIPTQPMDEAYVAKLVDAAKQATQFMQENGVKVANMSWRLTRPMIEGMLVATGTETDPAVAQARAAKIFEQLSVGLTEAFAAAPDVLFIAGAGNEDENVEFVQSVPAGLNLDNLITVGAVDQALNPAGFTSFGQSIDVYANGFEVLGRVPSGKELHLSGTSMAAPQVANIAAKMFAVNPGLTVTEAIAILNNATTTDGEQALKVVHDKRAVEAAASAK